MNSKKALRKDANVLLEFVFQQAQNFYNDLDKNRFEQLTMKDNKSELDKIFNEKLNKENLDKFKNLLLIL